MYFINFADMWNNNQVKRNITWADFEKQNVVFKYLFATLDSDRLSQSLEEGFLWYFSS